MTPVATPLPYRSVMSRSRPTPVDALLGLALGGLAVVEIWVEPIFQTGLPGPRVPLTVLVVVGAAAVALRASAPLVTTLVFSAATVLVGAVGDPDQAAFELALGAMLVAYTLGKQEATGPSLVGLGVLLGSDLGWAALTRTADDHPADVVVPILFIVAAWMVGREAQRHRLLAAGVDAARRAEAASHRARVTAATAEERTRIARELHDVVAHGVSVMGLEAAAVRRSLGSARPDQLDGLRRVEELGRETLVELHRMLTVLRDTGPVPDVRDEADRAPALGLADVPALCAKSIGPAVELAVTGDPRRMPTAVELAAYRIIQEALTNAGRHADARLVRVTVDHAETDLNVEIVDDGVGAPEGWQPGHGLIGMRERVAAHGGRLDAGPIEHGFRVRATLPAGAPR